MSIRRFVITEKALVRAFSVIVKPSRTFVSSSTLQPGDQQHGAAARAEEEWHPCPQQASQQTQEETWVLALSKP